MSTNHFWMRSEEIGDQTRRYLLTVHTGAIALLFAFVKDYQNKEWIAPSICLFCLGLVITGMSLFVSKHKSLHRFYNVSERPVEQDAPNCFTFWKWSSFWDCLSFSFFILGIMIAVRNFGWIHL